MGEAWLCPFQARLGTLGPNVTTKLPSENGAPLHAADHRQRITELPLGILPVDGQGFLPAQAG
jgi:hypothetical protein